IEGVVMGEVPVRICGLYLPNGNPAPGPKYDYKLDWMARLKARAADLLVAEECAVMAGDYNVIPQPEDCADTKIWADDALFLPQTRAAFREIVNLGFTDALRATSAAPETYTFWDYQAGAWERNNGIRIDHLLLTPQAADRLQNCEIDAQIRGREKPSDHVPIWIDLKA
ncbi:MAG: exodeoxyribonuclease III, partial [Pseudomonadota bacterium]